MVPSIIYHMSMEGESRGKDDAGIFGIFVAESAHFTGIILKKLRLEEKRKASSEIQKPSICFSKMLFFVWLLPSKKNKTRWDMPLLKS